MVVTLFVFGVAQHCPAVAPAHLVAGSKTSDQGSDDAGSDALPADLQPENVDSIIAGMSDERVRRLLIEELKKQAAAATPAATEPVGGLAGFIQGMRDRVHYSPAPHPIPAI
jgi:hypothetical protein